MLTEYSFTEGGEERAQEIVVRFRQIKNSFTLILHPVSHTEALEMYDVINFVGDPPPDDGSRATSGKI